MAYSNTTGLPSVTDALSCFINKDFFTSEHRERGTAAHDSMAAYLQGVWTPNLKDEWQGYVESGKRWVDENVKDVRLVEKRLCDRKVYSYTGQMDLVATLKNKPTYTGYGVIDWKTSIAMSPTYKGQIPAYDRLCKVNDIQTGNWGCIVRLRQTGQIALANFMPRQELDVELQYFLNALTAYRRYVLREF